MKKIVLSICMMIKNEEKNLRRCLDSLQPLREAISSELIIVDTGSEDNSVAIAKEYTDKVYFHGWNDSFSEMRNITINYAKGEWVFIIDGDEVLETTKGIIQFLSMPKTKEICGAALVGKSVTSDNENRFASIITPRIFRKTSTFRYEGIVHNKPIIEGIVVDTGDTLLHYGYVADDKELMERKFKRTSSLLKKELKKDPSNIYYWYQLGISYAMYKNWQMAIPMLSRAYELIKEENLKIKKDHIYVYGALLLAYAMNKDFEDEVIELALEGISVEPNYVDIYFYMAQIYIQKADYGNAKKSYLKYLELVKGIDEKKILLNPLITNYTLQNSANALYNLAIIFIENKDYIKARSYFQKILDEYSQEESFYKDSYKGIARVDFRENDYDNLYSLYSKLSKENSSILIKEFEGFLEEELRLCSYEEKMKYMERFKCNSEIYGILNQVRIKEELENNTLRFLERDWVSMPVYYAPIWMYSIKCSNQCDRMEVEKYWSGLSEEMLMAYMKYLTDFSFATMLDICIKSIDSDFCEENYQVIRMKKNILKFLIFSTGQYEKYFLKYVEYGVKFITKLYGESIISNEWIVELKNVEEVFFLYLSLAERNSAGKKIEYLNKAKDFFPEMKEGVRILLGKMLEETSEQKARENEIGKLKKSLFAHTKKLIEEKKFYEALQVIDEVEKNVGLDAEFLMLKTKILTEKQ